MLFLRYLWQLSYNVKISMISIGDKVTNTTVGCYLHSQLKETVVSENKHVFFSHQIHRLNSIQRP